MHLFLPFSDFVILFILAEVRRFWVESFDIFLNGKILQLSIELFIFGNLTQNIILDLIVRLLALINGYDLLGLFLTDLQGSFVQIDST